MKSFDYSHFEVTLTAQQETKVMTHTIPGYRNNPPTIEAIDVLIPLTLEDIDALRKEAARLADKAVEQYKIKKRSLEAGLSYTYRNLCDEAAKIDQIPEGERSEEHKAILKKVGDMRHAAKYDYQDDWPQEDDE